MFWSKKEEVEKGLNLSVFAEDESLKKGGVPIYPLSSSDAYFLVPRVGGFEYQKQIQKITSQIYGVYIDQREIDFNRVCAAWLGDHVQGWEGVDDTNGVPLEFTRANCKAIFNNEAYKDSLVPILIDKASKYEHFLNEEGREAIEELKKL